MITSLRLVNFKNFADETLRVGPFTVIVGANASGKSNIRDAFRFLHGIGRNYSLAEILGGKHGDGGNVEWTGIRGASNEVVRFQPLYPNQPSAFSMHLEAVVRGKPIQFSIGVEYNPTSGFVLSDEELKVGSDTVYETTLSEEPSITITSEHFGSRSIKYSRSEPVVKQMVRHSAAEVFNACDGLLGLLGRMRFMELSPERMRDPSILGARGLGDSGQNLPAVLEGICSDPARKSNLMSWLRELTPMDIRDFDFLRDPSDKIHLQVIETNGRTVSANSVSDGTLRFVAMLAALFGDDQECMYFFEEIDTGIHPNRLWLLLDLIEKQTAKNSTQVIATTHSSDLLNYISDGTFGNTSVVSRLEDTDDAIIRPVKSLPKVRELRETQGLGRLHSGGWMEDILNLQAWKNEDEEVVGA